MKWNSKIKSEPTNPDHQICPYCFRVFKKLSYHSCNTPPVIGKFDQSILTIDFLDEIYLSSDSVNCLDGRGFIIKSNFNQAEYQRIFLENYNQRSKNSLPLPEDFGTIRLQAVQNLKERGSTEKNTYKKEDRIANSWGVCPMCFKCFKQISWHECTEIDSAYPIKFKQSICTVDFLDGVYRKSNSQENIDSRGWIDPNFDKKLYSQVFIDKYNQISDQKLPYLREFARIRQKLKIKKLEKKKERTFQKKSKRQLGGSDLEAKVRKYAAKSKPIQKCPFCFESSRKLVNHQCSSAPKDFNWNSVHSDSAFFIRIYLEAGVWDDRGFPFIMKKQRETYREVFLRHINS